MHISYNFDLRLGSGIYDFGNAFWYNHFDIVSQLEDLDPGLRESSHTGEFILTIIID